MKDEESHTYVAIYREEGGELVVPLHRW